MRNAFLLFIFIAISQFGRAQSLTVFMTTTDETSYGACDGTITMWVEGAAAADSFMFLLDVDPLPVVFDTIIVTDTIITLTGMCTGTYTMTLDTTWGSCPLYGNGCCNCIGSTSCGGAAGAGASGTVGGPGPGLSFTVDGLCPDPCNSFLGGCWVTINGQAPPFLVNFGPLFGGWISSTSVDFDCLTAFPSTVSVQDATGQIVTQTNVVNCQSCGKSAILNNIPTIEVCSGEAIGPINFNSYLTTGFPYATQGKFSWTNNNTATGIPANSPSYSNTNSNDIFSFTAANVTSIQTSTITLVSNPWNSGMLSDPVICNGNSITFNIVVNPAQSVDAGGDVAMCVGGQVTLSGAGASNYTWNNGITNNVAFTPSIGTTTYEVTATGSNGCAGSDQVDVTVYDLPSVDAGVDFTSCIGNQITLTAATTGTPTWDNGITDGVPFSQALGTQTYTVDVTDANGCQNSDQINVTVSAIPTIDAGIDQTICDGDEITLSGSGGTTYVWDNGISDNVAFTPAIGTTTYEVTGTDGNGCQNSDQVEVIVNALPTINAGIDQTICDGNQITLAGSGGTTYVWDNGISDNVAFTPAIGTTTYEVTGADANGCENTDQVDVVVNALPTIDAGTDQTICDGDEITLAGSGGTTYVWDNGISDNVAFTPAIGTTTYEVTGSDANGCENTDQVDVTVNDIPTINGGLDASICYGDSLLLNASSNGVVDWTGGLANNTYFSPSNSQTEMICMATTPAGCQNSDTILVNMDNQINTILTVNVGEISAVSGYLNYEWLYCESNVTIQNGAQNTFTTTQDGSFRVVIRNNQNCYDTSECVVIDYLDVNTISENELIYLSPNPTTGKVFISNGDQIESIVVFDATGRVVRRLIGKTQTLDFSDLESGQYLIRMTTSDKRSVMARVIKQD